MKSMAVIPARWGSTRFEGKPLALILSKPMIYWVWSAVKSTNQFEHVVIATDDERIFKVAQAFGAEVVMTKADHQSGTDRVWEVAERYPDIDIVVNVQGDEPLINKQALEVLLSHMKGSDCEMATLATHLDLNDLSKNQVVKVLINKMGEAIYFSRYPVPYSKRLPTLGAPSFLVCKRHLGLYAFKKDFLGRFCQNGPCALEMAESLEQLRALDMGVRIRVGLTDYQGLGVDLPSDLIEVEKRMKEVLSEKN